CGQPVRAEASLGHRVERDYDMLCRHDETVDQGGGRTTTITYDGFNRPIETEVTLSNATSGSAHTRLTVDAYDDRRFADLSHGDLEDRGEAHPRRASLDPSGVVSLIYIDGFGRITKEEECRSSGSTPTGSGVYAAVDCTSTKRVRTLTRYGNDGKPLLRFGPHTTANQATAETYVLDGSGRQVLARTPDPSSVTPAWVDHIWEYTPRLTRSIDPLGNVSENTQTTLLRERSLNGLSRGKIWLNPVGHAVEVEDGEGGVLRIDYDSLHDSERTYTRDPIDVADPGCMPGACSTLLVGWEHRVLERDDAGRITREQTAGGEQWRYTYDLLGRQTTSMRDGVLVESIHYVEPTATTLGRIEITDVENGTTTLHAYDSWGREVERTVAGLTWTYSYYASGRKHWEEDPDGRRTTYTYDSFGRLETKHHPSYGTMTRTYTPRGELYTETFDADGTQTAYSYTYSGKRFRVKRGPFLLTEHTFDTIGRVVSQKDDGVLSHLYYHPDSLKLQKAEIGIDAGVPSIVKEYEHDGVGRVTEVRLSPVAGGVLTTSLVYNQLGWLTTHSAGGATQRFDYDLDGALRRRIDEEGAEFVIEYDARGRETRRLAPGGSEVETRYHPGLSRHGHSGLVGVETWDSENTRTQAGWQYIDVMGRTISEMLPNGVEKVNRFTGLTLDAQEWIDAGSIVREKRFSYDSAGRIQSELGPAKPSDFGTVPVYRVDYTYTPAGRVKTIAVPDGTTTFAYDHGYLTQEDYSGLQKLYHRSDPSQGARLTSTELRQAAGGGNTRTRSIFYDGAGRIERMTVDDGVHPPVESQWIDFNAHGQPGFTYAYRAGVLQFEQQWTYSPRGYPLARQQWGPGGVSLGTTAWGWHANGVLGSVN
ncbi:MAG: hypothetical protein AAFS10_14445, partial [Myxococcota bacterium]